ncbi:type 1 glutamine amidotransferase domain-containing protein [Nocardiopsis potens]|uniref:type 1 glutamine amidotransferase domain-containing protein n=1 Tax=Nocardiopsis potens TaxID=1246458 RepID=UPI00034C7B34|nr:type 1 glutamine amidotransferase domain-containing protein [Nocardiopsis potens]
MGTALNGKNIAILATDGVERVELQQPRKAVEDAGARTELLSLRTGPIQAMDADIHPSATFHPDREVARAHVDDYDALIVPGGTANPDRLRASPAAVEFVRAFVDAGKPVAAICHGPWILVEADAVRDRTLTSYPSIRTDIRNAGGTVVDEPVVTDRTITTSRRPDDLPAFCARIITEFAR